MNNVFRNTIFIIVIFLTTLFMVGCGTPKHKEFGKQFEKTESIRLNDSLIVKKYSYNKVQYDSIDSRWYFIEKVELKDTVIDRHTNTSSGPDIEFIGPRLTPNGFEVLPGEPGISFD